MYGQDQLVVSALERCSPYRELMYKEICYVRPGPASCVRFRDVSTLWRVDCICLWRRQTMICLPPTHRDILMNLVITARS